MINRRSLSISTFACSFFQPLLIQVLVASQWASVTWIRSCKVYGFPIPIHRPNRPIIVSFYPFVTALVAYDMNYFDPVFTCLFSPRSDFDRITISSSWFVTTVMAFGHAQTPAATCWNSFNQPKRCASPASKRYSILLFLMWSIITTAFDAVMAASVGSIGHHFTR